MDVDTMRKVDILNDRISKLESDNAELVEWNKVTDIEPEDAGWYLTFGNMLNGEYKYKVSLFLGTKGGFINKEYHGQILFWQPLPSPPQDMK